MAKLTVEINNMDKDEFLVELKNGWFIAIPFFEDRTNPDGSEDFYVRVLNNNKEEVHYWDVTEIRDDPALVVGAFLGCAQMRVKV